jgi:hypothetical protein
MVRRLGLALLGGIVSLSSFWRILGDGARHVPLSVDRALCILRGARGGRTCWRSMAKQGIPACALSIALAGVCVAGTAPTCPDDAPRLEPWPGSGAAQLWWVRAERGEASADNHGTVSNLLLVRDGRRLWSVGSGPTRGFGQALDCVARRDLGLAISDVISPWARPELVLGAAGMPRARHWAHADVARAMRAQCAGCVARLRQRLGSAAPHQDDAVRWPQRTLHGEQGRLGPFEWWRVERAPGSSVTLWRVRGAHVLTAHGLLWAHAVPDLRDSDVDAMHAATLRLRALAGTAAALLGEQGDAVGAEAIDAHLAYWQALQAAVRAAQARGGDANDAPVPPAGMAGIDTAQSGALTAHALNWQRAWRQAEDAALKGAR